MTIKWTEFTDAGAILSTDTLVGLRAGANVRFDADSLLLVAQNLADVDDAIASFDNISPLTTNGDLLYFNGTNNVRRAIGSSNDILSVSGGVPAWISVATARTNLGIAITPGAGTPSAIGGTSSLAAGDFGFAFGNSAEANGDYSFAFGNIAVATNNGSWVIGDSNATPNPDSAVDQFNATFANGYRLYGGDVSVMTAGSGLRVAEGSNAKQGVATLVSGVVTVSNTSVTANSRIFLQGQDANVTGYLMITARTPATSFEITSSELTDSGVVAYEIFEAA